MDDGVLSTNEVLQAIVKGLNPSNMTVQLFILVFIVLAIALIIISWIVRTKMAKENQKLFLDIFEKKIRKHDLTINEIDYVNKLSIFLKKPWKKYLLLSNKNTLEKSIAALEAREALDLNLIKSITQKIGMVIPAKSVKILPNTNVFFQGVLLKIITSDGRMFSAKVLKVDEKTFTLIIKGGFPYDEEQFILLNVNSFGIQGFSVRVEKQVKDNEFNFAHSGIIVPFTWSKTKNIKMDDDVFVVSTTTGNQIFQAYFRKIHGNLVLLDNPSFQLKKGQDIRIYFNQPQKGMFWANGEVYKALSDKRKYLIRLNHIRDLSKS